MGTCVHFSRSLPSNSWWQTMVGWQVLSRPSAAEGGGRRPAFTGLATQPYSATEVDGWQHKLSRVSQNRAAVQRRARSCCKMVAHARAGCKRPAFGDLSRQSGHPVQCTHVSDVSKGCGADRGLDLSRRRPSTLFRRCTIRRRQRSVRAPRNHHRYHSQDWTISRRG